jgi:hypothetical protein
VYRKWFCCFIRKDSSEIICNSSDVVSLGSCANVNMIPDEITIEATGSFGPMYKDSCTKSALNCRSVQIKQITISNVYDGFKEVPFVQLRTFARTEAEWCVL